MAIVIILKGSPSSGWYGPPKGTHSGEEHRQAGSGKTVGGERIEIRVAAGERNEDNARVLHRSLDSVPSNDLGLVNRVECDYDKVAAAKRRAGVDPEIAATGAMHRGGVITFASTPTAARVLHEFGHVTQERLSGAQWSRLDAFYKRQGRIYRSRVRSGEGIPGGIERSWRVGLLGTKALRGISNPRLYAGEKGLQEFQAEAYVHYHQRGWRMRDSFPGVFMLMEEIHGPSAG